MNTLKYVMNKEYFNFNQMAKLFSVKLSNLETEMNELKQNCSVKQVNSMTQEDKRKIEDELNKHTQRINELDTKINQVIDEITTILNQHANVIKSLQQQIIQK